MSIVKRIYYSVHAGVRTVLGPLEEFEIKKSVLQGVFMSLLVFNLFIDDFVSTPENSDCV